MSSSIWTRCAGASELRPLRLEPWRVVEAQHRVSTLKLVDSLDEQALLEDILEESKPVLPPECAGLDYLLATPFRYGAAYPHGSRFRRAGRTLGVYYAALSVETALAEMAFYRLLFFADSPGTPLPANAADYTAFSAAVDAREAIDLARPPLDRDAALWTDPSDYAACQALADTARAAGIAAILGAWAVSGMSAKHSPDRTSLVGEKATEVRRVDQAWRSAIGPMIGNTTLWFWYAVHIMYSQMPMIPRPISGQSMPTIQPMTTLSVGMITSERTITARWRKID